MTLSRLTSVLAVAALAARAQTAGTGCPRSRSEVDDVSGAPYALTGNTCAVHDPAIGVEGGRLFIFSTDTGPQGEYTGSLLLRCGDATNTSFTVCGQVFPHGLRDIPWYAQYAPTATNIWAPDVSYWGGKCLLYYAVSEFGKQNSVIGLATSPSLDPSSPGYGWTDHGPVLSTNGTQGYNAIDASVVADAATGAPYMVFGSFWRGIQLVRLNASTGLVDPSFPLTTLAQREGTDAIEGSFMVHRARYYYLFVSWNACCRGAASTYEVRMGRSPSLEGPFLDEAGMSMMSGGGTHLLGFPASYGWAAAGGQSLLRETVDAPVSAVIVHAYDGVSGDPYANIVGLAWDGVTGWPTLVPWP